MADLDVVELACVKQDRQLFEKLSFSLSSGQLLHLQGPNGAGKTSLLRILAGLSLPHEGHVLWRGKPIQAQLQDYGQALIYHGHKLGLESQLSAVENLSYWLRINGVPFHGDLFAELKHWGLVGLEDIPLGHLSAGQQRRVSLARLGLKSSALWILDEPFTALDKAGVKHLQEHIHRHLSQGGLVVLTSHQVIDIDVPYTTVTLEYAW